MRFIAVCRMKDQQVRAKLAPVVALDAVSEILLVRRYPLYNDTEPKIIEFCPPRFLRWSKYLSELFRLMVIMKLCLSGRKETIFFGIQMIPHGIYTAIFGQLFRMPYIISLVGEDLKISLKWRALFSLLKGAAMIGVRGENSRQSLVKSGIQERKTFCPQNVFNAERFSPNEKVTKEYDFVFVGDLIERKRPEVLIEAVAKASTKAPGMKVAFAGDGPLRANLEEVTRKLKLENNVFFHGHVAHEDVPSFLQKGRAFILTSRAEGLPGAMVEAISCGLPVVVPDIDDVSTVASHGDNAFIVSAGEAGNFAEAMLALMNNTELYSRLKQGALTYRNVIMTGHSLKASAEEWQKALCETGLLSQ